MTAPPRRRCATLGCGRPAVPGDAYCGECSTVPGSPPVDRRGGAA